MTVAAPVPARKPPRRRARPTKVILRDLLLAWYDRHRRVLPWRAAAGASPDPYAVWLSEIMLQQTTVKAVAPYFQRFTERFPTVRELAAADPEEVLQLWAGLGYYARARNLHACARMVVERHGGRFPASVAELRALPGVGDYTANAIAAIAFGIPVVAVDGNVERVLSRLEALAEPLPGAKPALRRLAAALDPGSRAGDFTQALMDLGATLCTPKKPACALCPWREPCAARRGGDPERFPVKSPKRVGALRRGAAFVAVRVDGFVLVRTRPPQGLLGGMTEVPTTDWTADFAEGAALAQAPQLRGAPQWRRLPAPVWHVFTHFPLELVVFTATVPKRTAAPYGTRWVTVAEIAEQALPNLMRKVIAQALPAARPARARAHEGPPSKPSAARSAADRIAPVSARRLPRGHKSPVVKAGR